MTIFGSCGQRGVRREVMIMTAIRTVRTAPRERTPLRNGLPELVPYVYLQQKHRKTYAARIARRNTQGWWLPPALPGSPEDMSGDGRGRRW